MSLASISKYCEKNWELCGSCEKSKYCNEKSNYNHKNSGKYIDSGKSSQIRYRCLCGEKKNRK